MKSNLPLCMNMISSTMNDKWSIRCTIYTIRRAHGCLMGVPYELRILDMIGSVYLSRKSVLPLVNPHWSMSPPSPRYCSISPCPLIPPPFPSYPTQKNKHDLKLYWTISYSKYIRRFILTDWKSTFLKSIVNMCICVWGRRVIA